MDEILSLIGRSVNGHQYRNVDEAEAIFDDNVRAIHASQVAEFQFTDEVQVRIMRGPDGATLIAIKDLRSMAAGMWRLKNAG